MSKNIYTLAIFVENKEVEEKRRELEKLCYLSYEGLYNELKKDLDKSVRYYFIRRSLEPYKKKGSKEEILELDKIHIGRLPDTSVECPKFIDLVHPEDHTGRIIYSKKRGINEFKYIEAEDFYDDFRNHYYRVDDKDKVWNFFTINEKNIISKSGEKTNIEKIKNIDFEKLKKIVEKINFERFLFSKLLPNIPIIVDAAIIDGNWIDYNDKDFEETIENYLEKYKDTHTIITTMCYMVSQEKLKKIIE